VWTRDVERARRLAADVRSDIVSSDMPNSVEASVLWGGFRPSGWGRGMGAGAIDLYVEVKSARAALS
jgi:acyl-CoA reductase-like NAD-dependent aldehyde dehydrogenase